jgi:uncharacterized protein (TIGR02302 family)
VNRPRMRILLGLARAAVFWERLWPLLWPSVAVAGLFLGLALLDWLPLLPGWLHGLVLVGFGIAIAAAARLAAKGFGTVGRSQASHRLERDSGLRHRPLGTLKDRLAAGDEALWRTHLERVSHTVRDLRLRLPAPGLARHDPYGIRAAVLLFVVIALAAGSGDAGGRLERALIPSLGSSTTGPFSVDVWISPPAYTRLAPMFLERTAAAAPVEAPMGSAVLAQVGGLGDAPTLVIGGRETGFLAFGQGGHRAEAVIKEGRRLAVELDGRELAAWHLKVIPDGNPTVEFTAPPARTLRAHLRIAFEAVDDYGLAEAAAIIQRADGRQTLGGGSEILLDLPLTEPGATKVEGSTVRDLTAHPWAGLPVLVKLRVKDGRGQEGESDVVGLVLPERIFNHPVARAIVDERRKLSSPSPVVVAKVVLALDEIAGKPLHFNEDIVVFLSLGVARARLMRDKGEGAIPSVQELLWNTALRLEDGELSIAEGELRRIQESLMRAMKNNPDMAKMEKLMNELQHALDKYLSAIGDQLAKQDLLNIPLDTSMLSISSDELRQLLEKARELARTGAMDAARQLLAEFRRMLNELRAGLRSGGKEMAEARRLMQGLRDLTGAQQGLLDKTFRRLQEEGANVPGKGQPRPGQGVPKPGLEGARQDELRRDLGKLMLNFDEVLGGIPQSLGKAERAMRDASRALDGKRLKDAEKAQTEALEQLRQGSQNAARMLVQRLGGLMGRVRPGRKPDPFGRHPGAGADITGAVKIPDRMDILRAREILQELRRRAGERQRPQSELDYIERLLKRF